MTISPSLRRRCDPDTRRRLLVPRRGPPTSIQRQIEISPLSSTANLKMMEFSMIAQYNRPRYLHVFPQEAGDERISGQLQRSFP